MMRAEFNDLIGGQVGKRVAGTHLSYITWSTHSLFIDMMKYDTCTRIETSWRKEAYIYEYLILRMNMITLTYGAILKGRKSKASGDRYRMSTSTSTNKITTQATWNQEEQKFLHEKANFLWLSVQFSTKKKRNKETVKGVVGKYLH